MRFLNTINSNIIIFQNVIKKSVFWFHLKVLKQRFSYVIGLPPILCCHQIGLQKTPETANLCTMIFSTELFFTLNMK